MSLCSAQKGIVTETRHHHRGSHTAPGAQVYAARNGLMMSQKIIQQSGAIWICAGKNTPHTCLGITSTLLEKKLSGQEAGECFRCLWPEIPSGNLFASRAHKKKHSKHTRFPLHLKPNVLDRRPPGALPFGLSSVNQIFCP